VSRVLLDTNVLVYAWDRSEDTKRRRALAVIEALNDHHEMVLSAQVLGEFFQVTTRKLVVPLTLREAQTLVADFVEAWPVVPITDGVVLEATRAVAEHGLAYWDAQLWAAARVADASFLLSEDLQDGRAIEGVRVINPFAERFDVAALG
jgi:predicted nucleic acid-binding protein